MLIGFGVEQLGGVLERLKVTERIRPLWIGEW